MGGRDWFQASVSAVGIPAVAGSDSGCDTISPTVWVDEGEKYTTYIFQKTKLQELTVLLITVRGRPHSRAVRGDEHWD